MALASSSSVNSRRSPCSSRCSIAADARSGGGAVGLGNCTGSYFWYVWMTPPGGGCLFIRRNVPSLLSFVGHPPVLRCPADAVGRIHPRQDELHAARPHGGVLAGVHFEGFLPRLGNTFEPLGVGRGWQHVADLDLHS